METTEITKALLEQVGYALTTLHLREHVEEMEIGVNDDEQGVVQRIKFDVDVHLAGAAPPEEDEIDRVLDYDFIRAKIGEQVAGARTNLLESLVGELLESLLSPHEVVAVTVSATKLDVYPDGAEVGCRMTRMKTA